MLPKGPLLNVASLTRYLIADNNRVESVYWRNATARPRRPLQKVHDG